MLIHLAIYFSLEKVLSLHHFRKEVCEIFDNRYITDAGTKQHMCKKVLTFGIQSCSVSVLAGGSKYPGCQEIRLSVSVYVHWKAGITVL